MSNNMPPPPESGTAVSPAEITGIVVSGVAILVFGAIIVYLCGRRGGFKEATQRGLSNLSHQSHPYTSKLPDEPEPEKQQTDNKSRWNRMFTRRHKSNKREQQLNIISSLQIHTHPGNNPHTNTLEFQAALQNLLGYGPQDVREWYPDHDQDAASTSSVTTTASSAESVVELPCSHDPGNSPLPQYAEIEPIDMPRRFSWTGNESDYRPEKR